MPQSLLYDPRLLRLPLPAPFDKLADCDRGKRYSTDAFDCSTHRTAGRSRMATLHPPTLSAILWLAEAEEEKEKGAMGIQKTWEGEITYYCLELAKEEGRIALAYHPENGRFLGIREKEHKRMPLIGIQEEESTGEEYMALFAYASLVLDGPLYDEEFNEHYYALCQQRKRGWENPAETLHNAYICCDNLYRRIESGKPMEEGGIPLDNRQLEKGVEELPKSLLEAGVYATNSLMAGSFKILGTGRDKSRRTIRELQKRYFHDRQLTGEEKGKVPALPDTYQVSKGAQEILEMVEGTPARIFMITGAAGVGKTIDAQIIAQLLNLPYYFFTCGPSTEDVELLASMMPNTRASAKSAGEWPGYRDFLFDPASALAMVSGTYEEGLGEQKAFDKLLSSVFQKGYEKSKEEKDFVMVESAIIKACRRPSLIEIQEPAMIEKSGTLTRLNALLDSNAATDLINGERIKRNPETVVVLTTNLDYIGCQMFNESVLSRMNLIQHRPDLSAQEMVKRVMQRTGCEEKALLVKMAHAVGKIQEYLKREEIHGGVCGYREYENWVWSYLACKNVVQASISSLISKASPSKEDREEILNAYIRPGFQEIGEGGNEWIEGS